MDESLLKFGEELGLERDAVSVWIRERKAKAGAALDRAREVIGDTEIAVDYTAYPYIIELAEVLIRHGFNVKRIYSDNFPADERDAFNRVISDEKNSDIKLYPTNDPAMRFAASCGTCGSKDVCETGAVKVLAIGQKAAYFTGTDRFVDIVEGGGMFGYDALLKLAGLMEEAFTTPKDTKKTISHKGWGCDSCL